MKRKTKIISAIEEQSIMDLNPEFKWVPVTKYLPPLVKGKSYSHLVIATNGITIAESFYVVNEGQVTWYKNNPSYSVGDLSNETLTIKGKWKDTSYQHIEKGKSTRIDVTHWTLLSSFKRQ